MACIYLFLISKYVDCTVLCFIFYYTIFGGLFQSKYCRRLFLSFYMHHSICRILNQRQWIKNWLVSLVSFVLSLNGFDDDDSTVNSMLIKDNKHICYLDYFGPSLKNQECTRYDEFIDHSKVSYELVDLKKSSHSRINWNTKFKKAFIRFSFDSTIKMWKLNNSNKTTFVFEIIDAYQFKLYFVGLKFVFSVRWNDIGLIKIKKQSEGYYLISSKVKVKYTSKEFKIDYLLWSITFFSSITGGIPNSTLFKCLHCYHPVCLTNLKNDGLNKWRRFS